MKTLLNPQEYYYLYSPLRADPVEMLKYTFQSLVLKGDLNAYYKFILINKNEKQERPRLFFKLGETYNETNTYTQAEQFVLSLFKEQKELRPYEIRNSVLKLLNKKPGRFKSQYVYKDVKQLGLCSFKYFLPGNGREAKNTYAKLITLIDSDIDSLLTTKEILRSHLDELGTGIIFLEKTTLNKLNLKILSLDELAAAFIVAGTTYGDGNYGGSYSGGSYSSSGSNFGDFGGGSGGGAGSGGSW